MKNIALDIQLTTVIALRAHTAGPNVIAVHNLCIRVGRLPTIAPDNPPSIFVPENFPLFDTSDAYARAR